MANQYNVACGMLVEPKNKPKRNVISTIIKRITGGTHDDEFKKCTPGFMCHSCRYRKALLCKKYHLYKKYGLKIALQYYFPNVSDNVIDKMCDIGVGNVERELRNYYENLYIKYKDESHSFFVNNILPQSFTYDNDVALKGNRFWKVILYMSIVSLYEKEFPCTTQISVRDTWSTRDDLDVYNNSDINYYYSFVDFFKLYLNLNTYTNTNFIDIYNIDDTNIDLNALFLIDSCKMLLAAFNWSITFLFDNSIFVNYDNHYYILNCFINTEFEKRIYVNIENNYDNIRHTTYEYLDLMVSNKLIVKASFKEYEWNYNNDSW